MRPPSPELSDLARRLLEDEAGRRGEPAIAAVVEEVFGKLRDRLARLIGAGGFEALLSRALKVARAGSAALEHVNVTPGGGLAGLSASLAGRSAEEALDASVSLLAHLLELIAAFIGDDLTAHLAGAIQAEDGEPRRESEDR